MWLYFLHYWIPKMKVGLSSETSELLSQEHSVTSQILIFSNIIVRTSARKLSIAMAMEPFS